MRPKRILQTNVAANSIICTGTSLFSVKMLRYRYGSSSALYQVQLQCFYFKRLWYQVVPGIIEIIKNTVLVYCARSHVLKTLNESRQTPLENETWKLQCVQELDY